MILAFQILVERIHFAAHTPKRSRVYNVRKLVSVSVVITTHKLSLKV